MKFTCISDTHGKHNGLQLPAGDVLIHAGDVSSMGKEYEILNFLDWFTKQDYEHKIFIAGNHDFILSACQMPIYKILFPTILFI